MCYKQRESSLDGEFVAFSVGRGCMMLMFLDVHMCNPWFCVSTFD
jgi:hypothetical protein